MPLLRIDIAELDEYASRPVGLSVARVKDSNRNER